MKKKEGKDCCRTVCKRMERGGKRRTSEDKMQIHIISIEPAQKIKLNNQEFPSLPSCLCVYVCVRVHVSVHLRSFF